MDTEEKNSLAMSTIKVDRKEYTVKKGDYILYNGACYQFFAGDGRILKRKGFYTYSNLLLPESLVKKIPFDKMIKKGKQDLVYLTKWYF
jgi:hypothetical protein